MTWRTALRTAARAVLSRALQAVEGPERKRPPAPAPPRAPSAKAQVLDALYAAQQEAKTIPATTSRTSRDGAKTVETIYAGSDDAIDTARAVLHRHGLMALPVSTTIDERRRLTIVVAVRHMQSGGELKRSFDVEVGEWGASAAAQGGFALALRLLLCLPRAPEQVRVRAPEEWVPPGDLDEPRPTHRVVYPPPILPRVQASVDRRDLEVGCQRLVLELARLRGKADHRVWKAAAGVPLDGPLSDLELRRFSKWLAAQLREEPEPSPAEPEPLPGPEPPDLPPPEMKREEHAADGSQ